MKLDLLKLEKRLSRMLDRKLRDPAAPLDVLELIPLILEHVQEHVLPTGDGRRVFPYDRVTVQVCVPSKRAAAARVLLEHSPGLAERIHALLDELGSVSPAKLVVEAKIVEGEKPADWGDLPFRIEYRERKTKKERPGARGESKPRVRLLITAGSAGARSQEFQLDRINIGRMPRVENPSRGAVRHNQLVFADDRSEVNATVSRAHAHIEHDGEAEVYLLFDDGSAQGTRVLRGGRVLAVPRQGSRGLRIEHGDELELGAARVKFLTE